MLFHWKSVKEAATRTRIKWSKKQPTILLIDLQPPHLLHGYQLTGVPDLQRQVFVTAEEPYVAHIVLAGLQAETEKAGRDAVAESTGGLMPDSSINHGVSLLCRNLGYYSMMYAK